MIKDNKDYEYNEFEISESKGAVGFTKGNKTKSKDIKYEDDDLDII